MASDAWQQRVDDLWASFDSTGREREAVALALGALAPHLPRYQRSVGSYARELGDSARPGH
jgi:hypothetical protein